MTNPFRGPLKKLERLLALGGVKKDVVLLALSASSLIFSMLKDSLSLSFDFAWVSIVLCGVPIVLEAIIGLVTEFDIKADVLVSIALIASICIGEYFAAGEVAFIMQLGSLLEDLTVARARAGIERLVRLTPQTARVLDGGEERIIPAEQVKGGDVVRVLPGESVPVDGVVVSGQTSVNQAVMTGESLPVDKSEGDEVSSGTVNQFGSFEMRATKVGEDSSIQRMIKLVQSADAGKAKIVGMADRWATWIVVIALAAAALTWIIAGELIRAVTVLVVFCPCSLVLATPTAIMAAIGNATRHGFLVKEGDALERLSKVRIVAFDKTGTLTYGQPEVVAVKSTNERYSEDSLYALAAGAEQLAEHPRGKAIGRCYGTALPDCSNFSMAPGRGVSAVVNGAKVLAGSAKLLEENGVVIADAAGRAAAEYLAQGCTVTYVAAEGELAGYVVLADRLRDESREMISRLTALGIQPVLLTGDNDRAANSIAGRVGIEQVRSGCLPEDKLTAIGELQQRGLNVCMIGDGVNDAPALKRSNVGIAMGGVGSDIAVDAADIALVDDEVRELPHLFGLSRRMMTTILVNLTFSMLLNFAAIALAIAGILNPVVGALVHNAGSVLVIVNSALLLRWKRSGAPGHVRKEGPVHS